MDSGELPEKVVLVVAEWSAPSLRKKKKLGQDSDQLRRSEAGS